MRYRFCSSTVHLLVALICFLIVTPLVAQADAAIVRGSDDEAFGMMNLCVREPKPVAYQRLWRL